MDLKIEAGKMYVDGFGRVTGPLVPSDERSHPLLDPLTGRSYKRNGACFDERGSRYDLVREHEEGNIVAENPLHDLLEKAKATVSARGQPYGGVEDNFGRIARLWSAHLQNRYGGAGVDEHDVAMMMVLLKIARLANSPGHADSWVDIAGYAACGGSMKPLGSAS